MEGADRDRKAQAQSVLLNKRDSEAVPLPAAHSHRPLGVLLHGPINRKGLKGAAEAGRGQLGPVPLQAPSSVPRARQSPLAAHRYPHDVVNHLSCNEAKNHYGGVVSLIPLVLDLMKEWVAHSEKLPRKALQHVSESQLYQEAGYPGPPAHQRGAAKLRCRLRTRDRLRGKEKRSTRAPWRPPGRGL